MIISLIDFKWKKYGRLNAWIDFFLTVVYCAVWITFACWEHWNTKHTYDITSNLDRFRFSLFIIGAILAGYLVFEEMKQFYHEYKYEKVKISYSGLYS